MIQTDTPDMILEAVAPPPADEGEIASHQWKRYVRARDAGHADYIAVAKRCEDFYLGNQWKPEDLAKIKDRRPALTINIVKPTVNAVLGEYVQKRAAVRFIQRNAAHQSTAEALSKVFSQIMDNNKVERVEQSVFEDGLIMERGYFDVRLDYSDSTSGEIRITSIDPLDVILDPDAREYDPRTWREVFITRWLSVDEIEELYGEEKAKGLVNYTVPQGTFGTDSIEFWQQSTFGAGGQSTAPGMPGTDTGIRRVRVIERQYKKLERTMVFVTPTGDTRVVPVSWTPDEILAYAAEHGVRVTEQTMSRIRWTITADRTVLHDDWSPYDNFTVIPFFPYFRRGRPAGIVKDMIDAQEQFNKLMSQQLHIVNSTANSGWVVEEGALINMTPDELAQRGAETGLVLEVAPSRTHPSKIQPNQIPSGINNIVNQALEALRRVSGVSEYMLGDGPAEVSGVALDARISRNLSQLQVVFDHLEFTRQIMAEVVLNLIQTYYTEPRILMMSGEGAEEPEEMAVNVPDPYGGKINDLTAGEYDVVIQSTPRRGNFEESQFAEAVQLRQIGVQIPDYTLVQYSHLERKQELVDAMKRAAGMGQPDPQAQAMAAMQQQIQMQQLQLTMREMEAKIAKLEAEAQLTLAKTAATVEQGAMDYRRDVAKIQAQIHNDSQRNTTKLAIAEMQAQAGKLRESQAQIGRYNQNQTTNDNSGEYGTGI